MSQTDIQLSLGGTTSAAARSTFGRSLPEAARVDKKFKIIPTMRAA